MPTKDVVIQVDPIQHETIRVAILGTKPLICNRMSEKARQQLLLPSGRKNAAEKAGSLKHDPLAEFRASPYTLVEDDAPTFVALLGSMFKQGMMSAALDIPGAAKAQIGRLVWVEQDRLPVYGIPQLLMAVTRSADINHTPDIRTRAILPHWACSIDITYRVPLLTEKSVINLLSAAGSSSGVGDWRVQKGSGTYGQFALVAQDDPTYKEVVKTGGRLPQLKAMKEPTFYDRESEELFAWYEDAAEQRGRLKVAK